MIIVTLNLHLHQLSLHHHHPQLSLHLTSSSTSRLVQAIGLIAVLLYFFNSSLSALSPTKICKLSFRQLIVHRPLRFGILFLLCTFLKTNLTTSHLNGRWSLARLTHGSNLKAWPSLTASSKRFHLLLSDIYPSLSYNISEY